MRTRHAWYAASAALVVAAAVAVPLPWVEYLPGDAVPIEPLVTVDGTATTPLDGTTSLLTVRLRQQPLVPLVVALLDDDRDLLPAARVYPSGIDRRTYLAEERARFARQFDVAAAVGAASAGVDVEVVTEVVVLEIVPGSPAEGALAPGDVVLAVDGRPLTSSEALQATVRDRRPGQRLTLTIDHRGTRRDVTITLADVDGSGQARIGVVVQTAVDELVLPFVLTLRDDVRIGGPSAGLMIGLTVHDLLSAEDLLAGRDVAGTGTLDVDGRVGAVGGVPQKARTALAAGADVLVVPRSQLEEARSAVGDALVVIGVDTLAEAIAALRDLTG